MNPYILLGIYLKITISYLDIIYWGNWAFAFLLVNVSDWFIEKQMFDGDTMLTYSRYFSGSLQLDLFIAKGADTRSAYTGDTYVEGTYVEDTCLKDTCTNDVYIGNVCAGSIAAIKYLGICSQLFQILEVGLFGID